MPIRDTHSYKTELVELNDKHGISPLILESLTASKEEATSAIRLFEGMAFFINGACMTLGIALIGNGVKAFANDRVLSGIICSVLGFLLFLNFCLVFIRQVRAAKAMKHFVSACHSTKK